MMQELLIFLAQPSEVNTTFEFDEIDWWWYTLLLLVTFVGIAVIFKKKWGWSAAGIMFVLAILYALFVTYALPLIQDML
ncbi:MAG TPA: hypothetical protein VFT59_02370 [Candidatus Saccharimonadales bacterium]|nr:hypothetical protein [Candidatus Saccharimonadales bacterium]